MAQREFLYDSIYFGEQAVILDHGGPELLGYYLGMRSYIKRGPGEPGNEVPWSKEFLRRKLRCSNDKFYRLLKQAYECGLIDIHKVPGFQGRNRNVYTINNIPRKLERIRLWEDRFPVVRSTVVRGADGKYPNVLTVPDILKAKLAMLNAYLAGDRPGMEAITSGRVVHNVGNGIDPKNTG